ncbi:MAG: SpoIIE family protein phosphatase [Bdellovibrionales bacterium]|nr:SpoIIE family protein phosphatase [Bdellovibrionales bacterium]
MDLKDKLLCIRITDSKLLRFLEKVGYELIPVQELSEVQGVLSTNPIDGILYDGAGEVDAAQLVEFIKTQRKNAELPIFFFSEESIQVRELNLKHLARIEVFEKPYSIGTVASRIATEMRLRKFAGADESTASVAEMNATLRDLTGRLKKDLEDARSIQQALLPRALPKDDRFELAASYAPLEEVGGDWFFVEKESDGSSLAVQIADVTGHGLSAAFVGSMTKLALSASPMRTPHELLAHMNSLLAPQLPEGRFVTMLSFQYSPDSGEIRYARAGHPPGLLLRRSKGEVAQLLGEGFPVGFFDEAEYTDEREAMEVGDILLVYTDCLPESQNMKGDTYGTESMERFLLSLPENATAAESIELLLEDFEKFRDGRIVKDDVTIVALKRLR